PLERARSPWIRSSDLTPRARAEEVEHEDRCRNYQKVCAKARHEVERLPTLAGVVRVYTPRHSKHAGEVHRKEREVHPDEVEPEMNLAQLLAHEATGNLREIQINPGENSHDRSAEQHVMEVSD